MHPNARAYIYLHIAVMLWGVTAILGKLISFGEYVLVWYRMGLVALTFLAFAKTWRGLRDLPRPVVVKIGLVGILVSLHWIFFYGAIKASNVSVTLSLLATISFMTSFIEPVVTGRRFQWYESFLGLLVVPGVVLIFRFSEPGHLTGIIMALLSAFFAAVFSSFNKKLVEHTNSFAFSFIQMTAGFLAMTLILPVYLYRSPEAWYIGSSLDYTYLGLLAVFCTTIPLLLYFFALRRLNAFITNLANNLEPVYGILLAWLIFNENQEMDSRFYLGSVIIIASIFLQPVFKRRFERS